MQTGWENEIPRCRLALWVGWRYYRRFAVEQPEDFRQTAALAALSVNCSNGQEAARAFSRIFAATCRAYGYTLHDAAGWIVAGRAPSTPPKRACGVPSCARPGVYRDQRYGLLCRHCREWLRRRAGDYSGIETRPPSTAGRVVLACAECRRDFTRPKSSAHRPGRAQAFCSLECYRAARRTAVTRAVAQATISQHAAEQFQARVAPVSLLRAELEIRRGLSKPLKLTRKRQSWEAECKANFDFRVRLEPGAQGFDVVTVLESRAANDQMRAARKERRRAA